MHATPSSASAHQALGAHRRGIAGNRCPARRGGSCRGLVDVRPVSAPSSWDIGGAVGGVVTLLTLAGAGIKALFKRADRREAALDRKEAELVAKLEGIVKEQGKRIEALETDNRKIWMALSYVVPALHAHDPKSPALTRAAQILGNAIPIDLDTPPDMMATLDRID